MLFIVLTLYSKNINSFLKNGMLSHSNKRYEKIVEVNAEKFGVNKNLIYAIIKQESNFFPYAKSKTGAKGLMQIMPITWQHAQDSIGFASDDLYNKKLNIMAGSWYLSYLIKHFGSEKYALLAYNAGIDNVSKWIDRGFCDDEDPSKWNIPFLETRVYLDNVLKYLDEYEKLDIDKN